jgi:hypothetical protein
MTQTEVELAAVCVTLFSGIIGVTWKASSVIGQMTAGLAELRGAVVELRGGLKQLARLDLYEQRLEQLETLVRHDLSGRVSTIWDKLFSLKERLAIHDVKIEAVEEEESKK